MAAQELPGSTLGEKHRHFNKLVTEAIKSNKKTQPGEFNAQDSDIENLIKIDVASKQRNVEYILKILQCEDMLYVSRAIKQSPWLITDRQYSHIINPKYLHNQLFPNMISQACSKLLLHIRLNLKDEDRVEDFYNFFEQKDIHAALRWLPHCSLSFVEKEVQKHHKHINMNLLQRLCEKSITILEIIIKKCDYNKKNKLSATMFLLKNNTERYLDIIEPLPYYERPFLGHKATAIIMKTCPQRVIDKFEKYADRIEISIFAKYMKKAEIKDFLFKTSENKELKNWCTFENLKPFVKYLPKEGKFEFVRKLFIEKSKREDPNEEETSRELEDEWSGEGFVQKHCMQLCSGSYVAPRSSKNIYRWYIFAPFEVAFPDLIKLIRAESAPEERVAMFGILLHCAGRNREHIQTLMRYYSEKHTNEPFKFKIQFVNKLLSKTDTHKFDKETWNLLDNLFRSMEVYIKSDNNVQSCVKAIIVYKLLRNESIPEIIEEKFIFESMKSIQAKLTLEERNKVFDYLYQFLVKKVDGKNIKSESELKETVILMETIQSLITDWKKNLIDYSWLVEKVRELIKIKNTNDWKTSFKTLYLKNKPWRRAFFEESLQMSPSDETCYNSLKHDPELMLRHKNTVEQIQRDDSVSLRRLLRALRVYWPQSLTSEWVTSYLTQLDQPEGHKALIRGFCILASQTQVKDIINKYAPTESKINWSEYDEHVLSLRKNLARNMYVSRPLLSADLVFLYAKGDYLQFALPSLNSLVYHMKAAKTREHLSRILDAPVSLQKHGIRYAFTKLEPEELKKGFHDIWSRAKNPSIRAVLFKQTYNLLCKQTKPTLIEEIWELLSTFIDSLSSEENKEIYVTLSEVDKVPLLVKGKFFVKSYKFLKALPAKANMEDKVDELTFTIKDIIEHLDPDFVAGILQESLDKKFTTQSYQLTDLIACYLLCAKDAQSQSERYNKILLPLMDRSFALWNASKQGFYVSKNFVDVLKDLFKYVPAFAFEKRMVFPTKLFIEIQNQLDQRLAAEQHYQTQTTWKLITTFVKLLDEQKEFLASIPEATTGDSQRCDYNLGKYTDRWNEFYLKAIPKFSEMCIEYLRDDIKKYFPSICWIFAKCLDHTFNEINDLVYLECLKLLLKDQEFIPSYLVVINNMKFFDTTESEGKIKEIRRRLFSNPAVEVKLHYYKRYGRHEIKEESAESDQ